MRVRLFELAERVGIEPTSARLRTDNGFEDRGGHQAPSTLQKNGFGGETPRSLPQGLNSPQDIIGGGKLSRCPF